MAKSLFKVSNGSASIDLYDNDGTPQIRVNGTSVLTAQQAAVASLTDSTGGTADGTLAAVPSDTLVNNAAAANNNFADVNAKLDAILSALRSAGLIAT